MSSGRWQSEVRTNSSSVVAEGLVSFSSAMVIRGGGSVEDADVAVVGLAGLCWLGSRKGLLEVGRAGAGAGGGWNCGVGSSKGEAGLLGKGDPARLRKGLLEERLSDRPGDAGSAEPKKSRSEKWLTVLPRLDTSGW